MDLINAVIVLLNYTIIPALTYGSQLALIEDMCLLLVKISLRGLVRNY